jgi:hypothetical protein
MAVASHSWRSAVVIASLLVLALAGGPLLPDFDGQKLIDYWRCLLGIPVSITLGIACLRSSARGDRLYGVVSCLIGGGLFIAFVLRSLYHLGVAPALI